MAPEIRFNSFGIPYLVEFANITFRSRARSRKASRASRPRSGSVTPTASIYKPSLETRPSFESTGTTASRPSIDTYSSSSSSRPLLNLHPSVHRNRASSRLSFESDWSFATASSETLAGPTMMKGKAQHKRDPKLAPVPTPPFSPVSISPILATEPRIVLEAEIDTRGRVDSGYSEGGGEREPEGKGLLIRCASQLAPPSHKLSQNRLMRLKYRIAKAVMAAGMHTASSPEFSPADDEYEATPRESYASIGSIYSEDVEENGLPGELFRGTYGQVMNALQGAGLTASPCEESGVQYATRLGALFVARQNACGGVDFTKLTLWA
ncbi:hypothetical protein GSI_06082 [Ganoderma sinense ZZ0214-1]|uniref:Uncharacterized protein n=1 Tax=Ganoderma sinense ZZ0214-1 TaxID=1077348 RepID=A0A2G8SCB7_9APHY|nr:hypothetical protein GSI_06082 [Ganoderma sinense ZZ0214-1]